MNNILRYGLEPHVDHGIRTLAEVLPEWMEMMSTPRTRWPVLNREERLPISSLKRALIHARDDWSCKYCYEDARGEMFVVDHIVPRSAFPADKLYIADRSDNLQTACYSCNDKRSNYEHWHDKRDGVTQKCWRCEYPPDPDWPGDFDPSGMVLPAWCGTCYAPSYVPSISWIL